MTIKMNVRKDSPKDDVPSQRKPSQFIGRNVASLQPREMRTVQRQRPHQRPGWPFPFSAPCPAVSVRECSLRLPHYCPPRRQRSQDQRCVTSNRCSRRSAHAVVRASSARPLVAVVESWKNQGEAILMEVHRVEHFSVVRRVLVPPPCPRSCQPKRVPRFLEPSCLERRTR